MAVPTIYAKLLEYHDITGQEQDKVREACKSVR